MKAKEGAYQLMHLFDEKGYPYVGLTMYLGGTYPMIEFYDADRHVSVIIVCTDIKYDFKARQFLDAQVAREKKTSEYDAEIEGHIAQPHSSDTDAFMLTEWIWEESKS